MDFLGPLLWNLFNFNDFESKHLALYIISVKN